MAEVSAAAVLNFILFYVLLAVHFTSYFFFIFIFSVK